MKTILITGGPCSGKTTSMELLRAHFHQQGRPVEFVAEAGTDLINEGITPASLGSMLPFQRQVANLQIERERAARAQAERAGADALVVCDRGIGDGAAYLSQDDYETLLSEINMTQDDVFARYDAVFCLESLSLAGEAYSTQNNAARFETQEEAAALSARTNAAWAQHPNFCLIPNADTLEAKAAMLIERIEDFLAGE